MKKELVQHLFEASENNREFEKRFQSFLDQIPKPKSASSAVSKPGFFTHFFLGMFADLDGADLKKGLKVEGISFKQEKKEGTDYLFVQASMEGNKKKTFAFLACHQEKSISDLDSIIRKDKIGDINLKSATKVLVGREKNKNFEVFVNPGQSHNQDQSSSLTQFKFNQDNKYKSNANIKNLASLNVDECSRAIRNIIAGIKNICTSNQI